MNNYQTYFYYIKLPTLQQFMTEKNYNISKI